MLIPVQRRDVDRGRAIRGSGRPRVDGASLTPGRPRSLPSHAAARSLLALSLLLPAAAPAEAPRSATPAATRGAPVLRELNEAVARLAAKVAPAVVQIEVTGYGPVQGSERTETAFVSRQRGIGSGVIVDPAGYVLTNDHVVRAAQRVRVVLAAPADHALAGADANGRRIFAARVVGEDANVDLALLKIEAGGLPFLPLDGSARVRLGELVFAIGSPEGLASTLTMGVVSSPARQIDSEQPLTFIQTDAPINPGNSGGPLVDVDGALVGINTFIMSQSGGSQGLGFAIPADVARFVYDALRRHGHVHRVELGLSLQTITPALAAGLGLPRDWGVMVSDVAPPGPAQAAGVKVGDVVESFDGRAIDSLAALTRAHYLHRANVPVTLGVLRGDRRLTLQVRAPEAPRPADPLADLASREEGFVRKLGIVGVDVSPKLGGVVAPLRVGTGVLVTARALDATSIDTGLASGDVIHAVNRTPIDSVERLRRVLGALGPGDPVALQIEREGRLAYLAFEME